MFTLPRPLLLVRELLRSGYRSYELSKPVTEKNLLQVHYRIAHYLKIEIVELPKGGLSDSPVFWPERGRCNGSLEGGRGFLILEMASFLSNPMCSVGVLSERLDLSGIMSIERESMQCSTRIS